MIRFSPKQRQVLNWWRTGSPHSGRDAIICDGAVRSGKTMCLGLSFACWAMTRFQGRQFALPVIKQQQCMGQFHEKTAVENMGDAHTGLLVASGW